MKKKRIYLIGKSIGSSRTQNFIKFLLDNNYEVYYNSFSFNFFKSKNIITYRVLNFIFRTVESFLKLLFGFFNLIIADIVFLPAMCNDYQLELKVAFLFRKKIITDFYISFYDTFVLDRNIVANSSRHKNRFLKIDKSCINKSTLTLFLNKTEANYYLNLLKVNFDSKKHLVVPLCIEAPSIKCNLSYYLEKDKSNRDFNICWWGNYIPLHGLENIIYAVKILNEEYDLKFHLFLFGTENEDAKKYKILIDKLNLNSWISIDNLKTFKNGMLGDFLEENCDLVLGNFGNSDKAKNVIVNKLVEAVALKVPILTGESIAPKEYFNEEIIFYSDNIPDQIAKNIFSISKIKSEEIINRVDKAYFVYNNNFSIERYCSTMNNILNGIN